MSAFLDTMLLVANGTAAIGLGFLLGLLVILALVGAVALLAYLAWLAYHYVKRWRAYRRAYWDRHDPGRPRWENKS